MIGGSITVSQDVLNYRGKRRESLVGTLSAGPLADSIDTPEYKAFVASYKKNFPDGYPSPGLFALNVLHQHEGGARRTRSRQG